MPAGICLRGQGSGRDKTSYVPPEPSLYFIYNLTW